MIPSVVVVGDEGGEGRLQVRRHLIGDLVDVPFQGLMVAFELVIGLRVVGSSQDMLDLH